MTAWLDQLAAPDLDRDAKAALEERIVSAGKTAVHVLLGHIGDARVCWTERTLLNEGELMNRTPGAPPLAERWSETPVTAGQRADELLHRIVTPPDYVSAFIRNFKPFQVGSGARPFHVADWPAFWEQRRTRTLAAIHDEMKRHVDACWQAHGVRQEVE